MLKGMRCWPFNQQGLSAASIKYGMFPEKNKYTRGDTMDVLALVAMGILYPVGDDVGDLLVPFIRQTKEPASNRPERLVRLTGGPVVLYWMSIIIRETTFPCTAPCLQPAFWHA